MAFGHGAGSDLELRLPGAVTRAPSWLKDAPFDVARFFEIPPPSQNAAPLYLDALLDFGDDMALCLPPDRRDRAQAAEAKGLRIERSYSAWDQDRDSGRLDRAEIDALAVVMGDALRKLDAAQRRPRCVFAEGIGYDVPIPHTQVGRRAVTLWTLLAVRAMDRGDLEGAIGYVRRILRLSQDIRPRGAGIDQLVGAAFDAIACNIIVPSILVHPRLRASHCDQLLTLLEDQEARIADSFAIGVKSTYIMERVVIRTFEEKIVQSVDADGRAVEEKLDADGLARYFHRLKSDILAQGGPVNTGGPRDRVPPDALGSARAQIRDMPLNFAREHQAADEWLKCMLSLPKVPYAQRIAKVEAVLRRYDPRSVPTGQGAFVFMMTLPAYRNLIELAVRDPLYVGAARCLIAARRWQLLHPGKLAGLGEICHSAGLIRVPIDGYGGTPLRMAEVAGEPVIYSIGPDGDDDGGLKDAELGRAPDGDFLFRLPRPTARPRR
jgi:hypothetical protein